MGKYTLPPRRLELAPGMWVLVPVLPYGELVDVQADGVVADGLPKKDRSAHNKKWLAKRIVDLAKVTIAEESGKRAFSSADDLRGSTETCQVHRLLAARRGEDDLPAAFHEWRAISEAETPDAGSDVGEVQLPAE